MLIQRDAIDERTKQILMKTNKLMDSIRRKGRAKKGHMGFQRGYQVLNDLINTFAERSRSEFEALRRQV